LPRLSARIVKQIIEAAHFLRRKRQGGEVDLKLRREGVTPAWPPCVLYARAVIKRAQGRLPAGPLRCSRVAEPQSRVAFESASPSAGDCIAGTLMAAIAAVSELTATTFCDRVFWRI
jgi:hypothetical protein